jgi:hypothetical protein
MAVPYTFGSATTSIPLSQLDSNFATAITLGNTAVQLGNTITTLTGVTNLASSGALTLGSNGNTTAIYVDTSQNVGFGTNTPATQVQVTTAITGDVIRVANGTQSLNLGVNNGSGGSYLFENNANALRFGTNGTERMRVNAGAPILCLSGGNTSATGTGIAFPATQSASSDANTLDDYEEGTWTPTITFNGGTTGITYNVQVGIYTKIGRMVHVAGYVYLSSKGSSTGSATLTNFPFASANIANLYQSATQGFYSQLATGQGVIFDMAANSSLVSLEYPAATSVGTHSNTTFNNNTGFEFSFVYQTA